MVWWLVGCTEEGEELPPIVGDEVVALVGTLSGPDGPTSYVAFRESLEAGPNVAIEDATLEITAGAGLFGPDGEGWFLVGRSDQPTLTRYDLVGDDLVEGATLSLASYGVVNTWASNDYAVFTGERAWFFSYLTLQVFEIDPETMTVLGEVRLDPIALTTAQEAEGHVLYGYGVVEHAGGLLVYTEAYDFYDDVVIPETRIARVDLESLEVTALVDARCGGTASVALGPDGALYTSTTLALNNEVGRPADPGPCALRVLPGATEIDPDFERPMADWSPGDVVAGLMFGSDGTAWTRVLPRGAVPTTLTTSGELYGLPSWEWARLSSDLASATLVSGPVGGLTTRVWRVADERVVAAYTFDEAGERTSLISLDGAEPELRFEYPGSAWGIVRLR